MNNLSDIIPNRDGHIYDMSGKRIKEYLHKSSGHYVVRLRDGDRDKLIYVHKIIAEAFIPNPDPTNLTAVVHIDGNKLNNSPDNLKWISPRERLIKAHESGRYAKHLAELNSQTSCALKATDLETGEVINFNSITEACCFLAAKFPNLNPINIRLKLYRTLKGLVPVAYNYGWRKLK